MVRAGIDRWDSETLKSNLIHDRFTWFVQDSVEELFRQIVLGSGCEDWCEFLWVSRVG